ncbi:MAG: porin [Thiomonas sp.]|uniref:porin n=1 Tax=Thiomonas sp. TaxID=2047785 RepID=UPI002A36FDE8|nr:porin [Thiomonas sp.]MDY0331450.1 porin [Thiomonas sp.]
MKKSLLALAVIGAFTGSAFAADNVQLYGIIDLGVAHFSGLKPTTGSGTVSSTVMDSGGQSSSRIGIKGTEDLGGGLKAIFQAETGFCAAGTNQNTNGSGGNSNGYCSGGGFMQRTSMVGLTGGFGTVVAGRLNTPLWNAELAADPFGGGLTGKFDNISNIAFAGLQRANQTIAYVSPNFAGFTGTAVYSLAPTSAQVNLAQGGNTTRAWELNAAYNNGPVFATLDYIRLTNIDGLTPNSSSGNADKHWQVTGGYDFGIAKVTALYQDLKADAVSGKRTAWMLGATVPVGAGAVLASYGQAKNTLGADTGADTAKQYAIGYTYSLSKRTNLYTSYAHISNDANTALAVGDSSTSNLGVAGQSSSGVIFGLRHKF